MAETSGLVLSCVSDDPALEAVVGPEAELAHGRSGQDWKAIAAEVRAEAGLD